MNKFIKRLIGSAEFNAEENYEKIKHGFVPMFNLPDELANPALDYMLERSFLEDVSEREHYKITDSNINEEFSWLRIDRLPVSPLRLDDYDLLSRWQSVLSSLHSWNQKLLFLLQRNNGISHIYIGVKAIDSEVQICRCKSALLSSMPGIDLHYLNGISDASEALNLHRQISNSLAAGAVTGIPSFRKNTQFGVLQTLDKLAFGFKDFRDIDANYTLMVIAEPLGDHDISDIIYNLQKLGSEIHTQVLQRVSETKNVAHNQSSNTGLNAGIHFGVGQAGNATAMGQLLKTAICTAQMTGSMAAKALMYACGISGNVGISRSLSSGDSISYGESVSKEYLNKFAQYTEKIIDKHCDRLRAGRDIGFWNTGVYVLSDSVDNVNLVTGILRSVYSGDDSHIEPIRTHCFHSPEALENIKQFNMIPIINPEVCESYDIEDEWHILGRPYQFISTSVNTEELSLFTSLPRKDVPGIRFVKNAVRFASNPGKNSSYGTPITIGNIVDTGIIQNNNYTIPINALVRHSLIVGSTGSGKTTTCKSIINAVLDARRPVLIIEPAKDEWVRWAINVNKEIEQSNLSDDEKKARKVTIFEPGLSTFDGEHLANLRLNPFQPAAIKDAPIDMQTRCEKFTALINSSLPTGDILPVIMEEAIYEYLKSKVEDFEEDSISQLKQYPLLEGVLSVAKQILIGRGYEQRVTDSLVAALETRFKYLTRGKRGKIFNELSSTSFDKLFNSNCVINLSKISNSKDKALVMSVLLLSLYEYRSSAYSYDENYRRRAQNNELIHLTVIEEAHNVLSKPTCSYDGAGNPEQVVADIFSNILSEVRSLGEGFMILDQVPTRLIPDVIKNTNYKICHKMPSIDDCAVLTQALALRDDQKGIIPMLEQGHAIIAGDLDDAASWVKILKPKINL